VEAGQELKETPVLLKTPSGYMQPSPWLAVANKQLEPMHRFMSDLGLSPVSRTRVSAAPPRLSGEGWGVAAKYFT
jgi:P27 family predicted phage terminase small subunit